jgi:hypothetical protein
MNRLHGIVVAAALVMTAFAVTASAGNDKKQFSLDMELAPPGQASAPFTLSATVKNEGNSTVNSFQLMVVSGLTVVGVDQPATGNATFTGGSVSVKNMRPLKSGDSLTVTLRVSSCGDGTWSATAWTGAALNGQTFDLVLAHSTLATKILCGSLGAGVANFIVPDSLNPDCVTVTRGFYDKDGSSPAGTLDIFVTNTVPINDQLHFRWPDFQVGGDPRATFEYTVCGTGPLPQHRVPPATTQVAWLNTDMSPASSPGIPAYIDAQDCLYPAVLPQPYGTLAAAVLVGDATITVNALSPTGAHGSIAHALPPFDIFVGTERMTVTDVSSDDGPAGDLSDPGDFAEDEPEVEVWTVTRAVLDGTFPGAYLAGQLVMSTPLPPLPAGTGLPYVAAGHPAAGKFVQAQMCIAAQTESGPVASPTAHTTTFIDIGDGNILKP